MQILTHASVNSTHTTIGASDKEDNIQMFPFGSEYTSTASKMPPLKKKVGYDQKVDIWAVGCLLFELLTGETGTKLHSFLQVYINFVHTFIHDFTESSRHSFLRSFAHLFIHTSFLFFIHSYIHSFISLVTCSFIRSSLWTVRSPPGS